MGRTSKFRPEVEALEDRVLMSVLGTAPKIATVVPVDPLASAQAVDLVTVPRQIVSDNLTGPGDSHLYSFKLQAGDYLEAAVQTAADVHLAALMSVLNSTNTLLAQIGQSPDPSTGILTSNPAYGFRASATDTYYVRITSDSSTATRLGGFSSQLATSGAYSLELHRLALARGQQDVNTLSRTGGMYAFLTGNTLNITGPTGYGFGINADWVQTTTRNGNLVSSTYTAATGIASIVGETNLAASNVLASLTLGAAFAVTTKAGTFGQYFGEVSSVNFSATLSASGLLSNFDVTSPYGFDLGVINQPVTVSTTATTQLGGPAGLRLGSSGVVKNTGAPVNNAVPYLYFTVNPANAAATNVLSVVCDPADPALYIEAGVVGLPIGPLTVNGIGFSKHGLIPYTPVNAPTQYNGHLGGNLVLQGSFDTTPITVVPSQIAGDITLNLDPNHTGQILGGQGVTAAALAEVFALVGTGGGLALVTAAGATNSPLGHDIKTLFHNFSVGINGTLKINPFADFQTDVYNVVAFLGMGNSFVDKVITWANDKVLADPKNLELLSLANGSMIYDGPTGSIYFHGSTVNPFKNTILAPFYSPIALDMDVAMKSGGAFYLDFKGQYQFIGLTIGGEVLVAVNYPLTGRPAQVLAAPILGTATAITIAGKGGPTPVSGIYLDANVQVLGANVDLYGKMLANGDLQLHGSADENLGFLSGSATFDLSLTQAHGFSFTADLYAGFNYQNVIRGSVDVQFVLGVHAGYVTYAGTATATGEVNTEIFGWQGTSVRAGVSNDEIWISAAGYSLSVSLP
jgi:hypothetical protein